MRVLWISGLPQSAQKKAKEAGVWIEEGAAWSWISGHFPPPASVELHVACLWPGGDKRRDFVDQGVVFHLLPCPKRGRLLCLYAWDAWYFKELVQELCPEVIHGWGTEDSLSLVAYRLAPEHHVVGVQGLISAYRKQASFSLRLALVEWIERWTLARAKWVVAESQVALGMSRPFCKQAKCEVVEHPLRAAFLKASPSQGKGKKVIFVGRLDSPKGWEDALEAFARSAPQDWVFHLVGEARQKERKHLEKRIKVLGLGGRVRHDLRLEAKEVVSAMQEASVFLLPTRIDTGPTALKEALCLGLWPISYDSAGPGEYLRQFEFGSLARPFCLEDLTEVLRRDFKAQPWLEDSRRHRVAKEAASFFSPERIWPQLLKLYKHVGEHKSKSF